MAAEQNIQNLLASGSSGSTYGSQPAIASDESASSKGLDFGIYLRMLVRNLPLIAIVSTLTATPFVLQALNLPKYYQGSFRLLVEPITSQGRANDPSALTRQTVEQNSIDYPTLLQVLQSPGILDKIAKQIRVKYPEVTAESLKQAILKEQLIIARIGNTQLNATRLIEVTYKGNTPEKVKFILEEFKKGYLRYSLDDRRTRIGGGVQFIEEQLPDLQTRVNSLQNRLQELRQRYQLANPETESSAVSTQLQNARSQRLETQRLLAEQDALYVRLQNQLNLTPEEGMLAASLSENPRYQEIVSELKKVETLIAVRSARFTDRSPVLESLLRQRDNLQQLLGQEAQQYLGEQSASPNSRILAYQNALRLGLIRQLVETDNTRQLLRVREAALSSVENDLNQRFLQFPLIVREYNDIQQQLEIATKTLNQFLTQRETLRVEAAQKEVPWEVVADPDVFRNALGQPVPVSSKPTKQLAMGLGLGLGLGLALTLLKEALQNKFFSSKDIASVTKLPILGVVPRRRGLAGGLEANVSDGGQDAFSQAFASLYASLRFLPIPSGVKSLVVSAAGEGDGTTTIAAHLAMAAAAVGQRVLLVDGNLRSPRIHSLFHLSGSKGLSDLFTSPEVAWQDAVQPSSMDDNLLVLTAGTTIQEAVRLLASTKTREVVRQLENAFDLVIFDTPNLTAVNDANFLSAETGGMLMVVSIGRAKQSAVKHVVKELEKFQIKVLGVVSNHVERGYAPATESLSNLEQPREPGMLEDLNIFRPSLPAASEKHSSDVLRS